MPQPPGKWAGGTHAVFGVRNNSSGGILPAVVPGTRSPLFLSLGTALGACRLLSRVDFHLIRMEQVRNRFFPGGHITVIDEFHFFVDSRCHFSGTFEVGRLAGGGAYGYVTVEVVISGRSRRGRLTWCWSTFTLIRATFSSTTTASSATSSAARPTL